MVRMVRMVWGRLFGFRGQVFVTTGRTTSGLVDAIELDYVALNRDFLTYNNGSTLREANKYFELWT